MLTSYCFGAAFTVNYSSFPEFVRRVLLAFIEGYQFRSSISNLRLVGGEALSFQLQDQPSAHSTNPPQQEFTAMGRTISQDQCPSSDSGNHASSFLLPSYFLIFSFLFDSVWCIWITIIICASARVCNLTPFRFTHII